MIPPFYRIPIFVSLLDALPITIADGFVVLESDVAECLVVQIFGQRLTLPVHASATDDTRELVFEGTIPRPLVDIPNVCSLSIPQLRIGIQSSTSLDVDSLAFDIMGEACLELHLPAIFGANSVLLDGKLHVVTQNALSLKHLRIDFDHAAWSLPLPANAFLWIYVNYLDVSFADDGSPRMEMQVGCSIEGLAPRMQRVLGQTGFQAQLRWTKDGATLASTTVCDRLKIPLPSFEAFGGGAARNLDELTLSAKYLRINIGRTIECSVDVSVSVPEVLRDIMSPQLDFRLSTVNEDVRIELLSSPFRALDCARVPNGNLRARIRVGEGRVSFDIPSLRIDWARRTIVAEGQVAHQNLRIPLGPLRSLLERTGMQVLAQHLPETIPFQSFGLTGVAAALSDLLAAALQKGSWADPARYVLGNVSKALYRLPPRVQRDFLQVHVPKEIAFRLECTFDLDARVHLAPSNDPIRAEASPIRLLVPFLGPHGPELCAMTLYRWTFGELRAGQLFTVEVDAEVESFVLAPLSFGQSLLPAGISSSPHEMQSRLVLRDVVALVGQSGGAPWMVPLSFRKIGWTYVGHEGMSAVFQCSLSLPKVDFQTLIPLLLRRQDPSSPGGEPLDWAKLGQFECQAGPAYLRLPRYLGSKEFGSPDAVVSLRTPKELERLLSVWQTLDVHRFLDMIPSLFGFDNGNAARLWSSVVVPFLVQTLGGPPNDARRGEGSGP